MKAKIIKVLRQLPLLRGTSPEAVELLAQAAVERRLPAGHMLIEEGSSGRELYIIVEGGVEVVKGQGKQAVVLARRGPGEFMGEMGLLEATDRFATVRTVEPTRLFEFSERDLNALFRRHPDVLLQMVRALSARLRATDLQMIADLQEKNAELARAYRELQAAQAALVEKERLEREMELARELQESILPRHLPRVPGLQCAAHFRPAHQVGGDFYDAIALGGGRLGVVMADVSGKGMPAALYMALARSLVHTEAPRRPSPRQVLLAVNRLLREITQAEMFITVFYGVLDPGQGTLRYARAGHDRPLLYRPASGECQFLEAAGTLLGFMDTVHLEEGTAELRPGDLLVLYSDGITDAQSPAGEAFGLERLRQVVCAAGRPGAEELADLVYEQVGLFQTGAEQYDDMTLLVVGASQSQQGSI